MKSNVTCLEVVICEWYSCKQIGNGSIRGWYTKVMIKSEFPSERQTHLAGQWNRRCFVIDMEDQAWQDCMYLDKGGTFTSNYRHVRIPSKLVITLITYFVAETDANLLHERIMLSASGKCTQRSESLKCCSSCTIHVLGLLYNLKSLVNIKGWRISWTMICEETKKVVLPADNSIAHKDSATLEPQPPESQPGWPVDLR